MSEAAHNRSFEIRLNGESRPTQSATIGELLQELELHGRPVAVELNRTIIDRTEFSNAPLSAGDSVEIIQFVGGG